MSELPLRRDRIALPDGSPASRRVAFWTLTAFAGLAAIILPIALKLWWDTAAACLRVYIWQTDQSLLFRSTRGKVGLWESLICLDISSASALVLVLLSGRVLWMGYRNTVQLLRNDKDSFWTHAYPHPQYELIPPSLRTLFVQLGLLGTLLSFILAANLEIQRMNRAVDTAARPATGAERLEEIGAAGEGPGAVRAPAEASSDRDLSDSIFVLLCASLYSSLIGCAMAYLVVPPLNALSEAALGANRVAEEDEGILWADFLSRLRGVTESSDQFNKALGGAGQVVETVERTRSHFADTADSAKVAAEMMARAGDAMSDAGDKFERLTARVDEIADKIAVAGTSFERLSSRVEPMAAALEGLLAEFRNLTPVLQSQALDSPRLMQTVAKTVEAAARRSEQSADHVSEMALLVGRSQSATADVLNTVQASLVTMNRHMRELKEEQETDRRRAEESFAEYRQQIDHLNAEIARMQSGAPFAPPPSRLTRLARWFRPQSSHSNGRPHN